MPVATEKSYQLKYQLEDKINYEIQKEKNYL